MSHLSAETTKTTSEERSVLELERPEGLERVSIFLGTGTGNEISWPNHISIHTRVSV